VHQLDSLGRWWRHGYHQGAPFGGNITSVAALNGYVYVGSHQGMARMKGSNNPAQVDTLSNPAQPCNRLTPIDGGGGASSSSESADCSVDADPWTWSYYHGQRYLTDNDVLTIVPAASSTAASSTSSVVLVATATGISYLQTAPWTLAEKSAAFEQFQYPRHDRRKLTSGCGLNTYGDVTSYFKTVGDNDGLWTAMHGIGEAYNYAVTGSEAARKEAWRAFEGLEMLNNVTGAFPTFPARTYCYTADGDAGCGSQDGESNWHASTTYEGVMWKGDTSR
jgi:hypothetical protein